MNKNITIVFIIFFIIQTAYCAEPYSPEWVMYFQNYVVNRQANESVIFNALNLSDEQRVEFLKIINRDDVYYKNIFDELLKESYKLQSLHEAGAGYGEIVSQKNILKSYGREIKKIARQENRDLKHILTRSQRAKYSMIKKLERHDLKTDLHAPDYFKKNPQMHSFGDPKLDCLSK